jgi:hypothetical protein
MGPRATTVDLVEAAVTARQIEAGSNHVHLQNVAVGDAFFVRSAFNVAFLGQCDDETVAHQLDDDGCSIRLHYSSGQMGSTPLRMTSRLSK